MRETTMKKNILMIFGIGDTFCHKDSYRFLKAGEKILGDVQNLLKQDKKEYFGYVNVLEYNDSNDKINPLEAVKGSRVIDLKLFNAKPFSKENYFCVKASDGEEVSAFSADSLGFVLSPSDYNIFICGIDINGSFSSAIDYLIEEGFYITVFSDIIKPYSKDTIEYLIGKSKDKNNHLRFGKS